MVAAVNKLDVSPEATHGEKNYDTILPLAEPREAAGKAGQLTVEPLSPPAACFLFSLSRAVQLAQISFNLFFPSSFKGDEKPLPQGSGPIQIGNQGRMMPCACKDLAQLPLHLLIQQAFIPTTFPSLPWLGLPSVVVANEDPNHKFSSEGWKGGGGGSQQPASALSRTALWLGCRKLRRGCAIGFVWFLLG